jgi:beta-glucuronidase
VRLALAMALVLPATLPAAEPEPLIANVAARESLSLDGTWRTIVDPYQSGLRSFHDALLRDGYFKDRKAAKPSDLVEYDFDTSPTLRVPGDWNSQRLELLYYEGTLWYRRRFSFTPAAGRRYFLHFGAVAQRARVFLNGELVGEHEGGFTPFSFEVGAKLRAGDNSLVVQADNTRRREAIPTLQTDWWNYGGITRPVSLVSLPETFVRDYLVQLERGSQRVVAGWVQLDGPQAGDREVVVRIPEAKLAARARTDAAGRAQLRFEADLALWSPEQPKLYDVEIASETDSVHDAIGFRGLEVRGRDILLNGRSVFLRGICIHEEAPYRGGRAFSREDAQTLLGWAKELGANFVRLAHYPHSEAMVREADRLGLMVWSEIPVYWSIAWDDPRALASARQQLVENVTRDKNRAAVALWSVANETPLGEQRDRFLGELIDEVRRLDPTRLVTAALLARYSDPKTLAIDDPIGARLDVIANNEYIGWYDGPPEKADTLSVTTPHEKPLIMSEFGGSALYGLHAAPDVRWSEEYQESLYEHQLAMLERIPFLRGMAPWILMDFRSPRRVLPGIQDGFNRKGLVSDRGQRKKAFYVLQRHYRERAAREKSSAVH